jgi:hypothetical protein
LRKLLLPALAMLAFTQFAFAQDDADIPRKFQGRIAPDVYHQMLDDYLNLVRGLPADPSLRTTAIQLQEQQLAQQERQSQQRHQQQRQLFISRGVSTAGLSAQPAWTSLGPSPIPNGQVTGSLSVTGRVTAFQIDPTNSNVVYLGTAQGGVYRSLNGGITWLQIFDNATTSAIGALALAPSDHTKLFVGTGEANGSADSYAGVGIYRIDNCDSSATLVGPINPVRNYLNGSNNPVSAPVFNGRSISSILVHPTDPSIVFVGVTGGVIGIGGESPLGNTVPPLGMRGLIRLTNATSAPGIVAAQKLAVTTGGSGFDSPNTGNRNVDSMVFDPTNSNNMVVWINGSTSAGDGGIYRSTNAQLANPTFTQTLVTTTSSARGILAVYSQASAPNVVMYVADGESSSGRLRVSSDGGATWSAVLTGGAGFCGGQCFYNIGIDVLPGPTAAISDDIIVLGGNVASASTTHLFAKSTNGGASFTESSNGLHADTHFIRIDRANTNVIYHGDDGGIFKSTDGGATWGSLNTVPLNTVQFSGLAVHPTDPKWSIGGTQDNGTNMRKSDGTWVRVDYGDGGYALVDRNATDTTNMTLYHTYFNQTNNLIGFGRVLSSNCATDGQWSFKGVYGGSVDPTPFCDGSDTFNGIALTDVVLFYAPMELGPGNPSTVYFGAGAVYRSADKGETMPAVSQRSTTSAVSSIAVSPQDDNYRLFGRADGSLFYTTTGANPMTQLTGIPAKYIGRVKFDPNNKNTAYVALGGYFGGTAPSQSHIWKVTNLNTVPVVTGINNGMPDIPVNAFAIDPANSNFLYAGTDIGVYSSTDGGSSWAPFGTGLPVVTVFGMEIQPQSRKLRIGTHGRGMWDTTLPDSTPPTVTQYRVLFGSSSYNMSGSLRNRLPWQITGIQVTFSEPVTASMASLTGLTVTGLSGNGTNTLTFSISPVSVLPATITRVLGTTANAVTDLAGNALGGGVDFTQSLKVLYGDFNDDGVVNSQDAGLVNAARSQAYNIFADIDGNGVVDANDVRVVQTRAGSTNY